MADTSNLSQFLTDVADAIRTKKETTEVIPAEQFDTEILSIETGVDTSDATANMNDIISPKTAYVNGSKVTGSLELGEIFNNKQELIQNATRILNNVAYTKISKQAHISSSDNILWTDDGPNLFFPAKVNLHGVIDTEFDIYWNDYISNEKQLEFIGNKNEITIKYKFYDYYGEYGGNIDETLAIYTSSDGRNYTRISENENSNYKFELNNSSLASTPYTSTLLLNFIMANYEALCVYRCVEIGSSLIWMPLCIINGLNSPYSITGDNILLYNDDLYAGYAMPLDNYDGSMHYLANDIGVKADKLIEGSSILGIVGTVKKGIDVSDTTVTPNMVLSKIISEDDMGTQTYAEYYDKDGNKVQGTLPYNDTPTENGSITMYFAPYANFGNHKAREDEDCLVVSGPSIATQAWSEKTWGAIKVVKREVARAINLTADKIVEGNTILGIEGTGSSELPVKIATDDGRTMNLALPLLLEKELPGYPGIVTKFIYMYTSQGVGEVGYEVDEGWMISVYNRSNDTITSSTTKDAHVFITNGSSGSTIDLSLTIPTKGNTTFLTRRGSGTVDLQTIKAIDYSITF